jgi:hypothetical protein
MLPAGLLVFCNAMAARKMLTPELMKVLDEMAVLNVGAVHSHVDLREELYASVRPKERKIYAEQLVLKHVTAIIEGMDNRRIVHLI